MSLNNVESSNGSVNNKSKKKLAIKISVGVLLLAILVTGIYFIVTYKKYIADASDLKMGNGEDYDPGKYKDVKMSPTIDIPGFKDITFEANKTEQYAGFTNPENNTVHFKMTLVLLDKNNKEEELWKSDLIEPGKACNTIKLNRGLAKGTYKAKLKYECYSVKNLVQQNGSDVGIDIIVK